MSTRLFLKNDNSTALGSSVAKVLSTQQGFARITSDANASASGPSSGIQVRTSGGDASWYSPPFKATTISGDITIHLWGYESSGLANVGPQVKMWIVDRLGSTIRYILAEGEEGVEFDVATSSAHEWILTPSAPITVQEGDRIKLTVFGNDAGGMMATGHEFYITFGASQGNDGDSWIELTENVSLDIYPTPTQDGPQYLKYLKRKKDYSEITVKSVFEDGGVDTLEHAADAAQRYEFVYDGLGDQEADVLDDFWTAHRLSQTFSLIEPRDEPWTGAGAEVEVQFESFEGDHDKVWIQSRKVVLVHYP